MSNTASARVPSSSSTPLPSSTSAPPKPPSATTLHPASASSSSRASKGPSSSSQHGSKNPSPSTSPSTLPHSPETARQIAEARSALEASMTNIGSSLSANLQSRATNLHANSEVIKKQEESLRRETEALRKENEKLNKLAVEGSRKVKELGNVQNWAEMLERDFLVLEETLRLAREESGSEGSWDSEDGDSERGEAYGERDEESLAGDLRRGQVKGLGEWETRGLDAYMAEGDGEYEGEMGEGRGSGGGTPRGDFMEGVESEQVDGKGKEKATNSIAVDGESGNTIEEHMETPEGQHSEVVGGSSTAGTGSHSEPSSSSVHTNSIGS